MAERLKNLLLAFLLLMMVVLLSICLLTTIYSYKLHKEKQRP